MTQPVQHIRASDLLLTTMRDWQDEHITIDQLSAALGERAFGVVMLLFAIPNCIPAPPGMNSVFGLPLLLYAAQLMRARGKPWQPAFIARRKFKRETLIRLLEAAEPKLKKVERFCQPRWLALTSPVAERLLAAYILLLSLCIIIPLWGTNFIPAIAAAILSVALLERDGVLVGIGLAVGMAGIILTLVIVWTAFTALKLAF
jgi:hypothetical protein